MLSNRKGFMKIKYEKYCFIVYLIWRYRFDMKYIDRLTDRYLGILQVKLVKEIKINRELNKKIKEMKIIGEA